LRRAGIKGLGFRFGFNVELYPGRYPAIVKSYDKVTRMCRVEIPGITQGGDVFPLAEIEYPIGDKSRIVEGQHSTEIEILVGDPVWVAFIGGDARYPIITGYRNSQSGNSGDWRRWHHANMALSADHNLTLTAGDKILLTVGNATVEMLPDKITLTVDGSTVVVDATGTFINGTKLEHNGKNVGSTHTHSGVESGPGNTGVPN
jgi:hypothetical protein